MGHRLDIVSIVTSPYPKLQHWNLCVMYTALYMCTLWSNRNEGTIPSNYVKKQIQKGLDSEE